MAARPNHDGASRGVRHTQTTELAGIASKATDAHATVAPSPTRRTRPASLRSFAVVTAIVLVAGVAAIVGAAASGASSDPAANSVRAAAGAPAYGPDPGLTLNANFVDIAATPSGHGYWVTAADGGVFARGDARFLGSAAGFPLLGPVTGIAATPSGNGYWLAAADGGVFTFGDAHFDGSLGGYHLGAIPLNGAIVAMAATPSGHGYWLLGADGGVFRFGDAGFYGSAASMPHNSFFVGIGATRTGHGYYLLEANGGVFTFGDARFAGSAVDGHLSTGIAVSTSGHGYSVARSDGSVAGFGGGVAVSAPAESNPNQHPVVAIAARRGSGVWLARAYSPPPPPASVANDLSQDAFLACTRAHESDSAGGYRAVSSDGVYRGAYQFLPSTWDNVARHIGRFDLVGLDPAAASPADQDTIAWALFQWQGYGPWGNRCGGLR